VQSSAARHRVRTLLMREHEMRGAWTIRAVYRVVWARLVIAGVLGAACAMVGCGTPDVRASAVDGNLGAVSAAMLMDLGGPSREQRVVDPETGEAVGFVRTSSSIEAVLETGNDELITIEDGVHRPIAPGRWMVRTQELGLDGTPEPAKSAGHLIGPYGGVYLSWSRSVKDTDPDSPARLYVFEPPLVWYPAAIEPGVTFEDTTRMTERDPGDETRVVLRGKATRRVAIIDATSDAWPFAGPDGARTGRAVLAELRVSVGPAEAVRRTAVLLDDDGMPGDEFVDYAVRVFGVPFTRERTLIVSE
jgi:hypothetical protein